MTGTVTVRIEAGGDTGETYAQNNPFGVKVGIPAAVDAEVPVIR